MAQTTEYYSMKNAKIEMSVNGSVWTDISGQSNLIEWDGFERKKEFKNTFSGDTPLLTAGKREGGSIKMKAVYTEAAADVTTVAQSAYDNATDFYLRWSPRGGLSGQKQYTSSKGVVSKPVYPGGDAESAETVLVEVEMAAVSITVSTIV